jgi:hypothetical protein
MRSKINDRSRIKQCRGTTAAAKNLQNSPLKAKYAEKKPSSVEFLAAVHESTF